MSSSGIVLNRTSPMMVGVRRREMSRRERTALSPKLAGPGSSFTRWEEVEWTDSRLDSSVGCLDLGLVAGETGSSCVFS